MKQRFGSKSGSEEVDNICSLKNIYLLMLKVSALKTIGRWYRFRGGGGGGGGS